MPRFHEMGRFDRASEFEIAPNEPARWFAPRMHRTFAQNHRGNFGAIKSRESNDVGGADMPALPGENVEQFFAVAADDGLDLAMHAAIRAAGDSGAVLALRTFKNVSPAHAP